MPEILSQAEILRLARRSAPSTRSSSPGPSWSYSATSPAMQAGALSPPPPTHYLRNKSCAEDTSESSLKLLRKRSEIYDRDRDRSRRSVVTRAPHSNSAAPDGLLFQEDLFRPAHLESSYNRGRTRLPDGLGSPSNSSPSFSPSKPCAFLETEPMSPSPMKSPFARERDSLLLLRSTHSHSTEDGSPGEPARSLTEPHAANSAESHVNPVTGSSRGSFPGREAGTKGGATHRHSLNRFHRGRSAGSDSSISISVSSHASSSFFSSSLEPCSNYSPPVQSSRLPQFAISGTQTVSPATPGTSYDGEPYSPLSFAPPSPRSAPALFDVQKRRRAHAFDHFTSYTESLPYSSRSSNHNHHNQRERSSLHDPAVTVSEPIKCTNTPNGANALYAARSVPDFRQGGWEKRSVNIDLEDEQEKGQMDNSFSALDAPRRKSSCRIMGSIKSMLTLKNGLPTRRR